MTQAVELLVLVQRLRREAARQGDRCPVQSCRLKKNIGRISQRLLTFCNNRRNHR